jgi:hypothetical protein
MHLRMQHPVIKQINDLIYLIVPVDKTQLGAQFFLYVNFYSLHVSGNHVPIVRRIVCINTTPGTCHSVWMTIPSAE